MTRYLITGTAGFIASVVAHKLLEGGAEVVGIDNLNRAYDVRMKEYRLARLQEKPGFRFLKLDVSNRSLLKNPELMGQNFDAVINLAARAGVRDSLLDPWVYLDTNATGTLNLLEFCRQEGISKFLLASTAGLYGEEAPRPTTENEPTDHPLQVYAASKKAAEALTHAYHYLYGIDITVVRYFNVYGPAGRPDSVMFRFVKWIEEGEEVHLFGDGSQSRGFTYVDDIAHGTIAGLRPLGYEILNLGGHEPLTILQLITMLEEYTGKKARIVRHQRHKADLLASLADISRAKALLEWEPKVPLSEGVKQSLSWYQQERDWARDIHLGQIT